MRFEHRLEDLVCILGRFDFALRLVMASLTFCRNLDMGQVGNNERLSLQNILDPSSRVSDFKLLKRLS